jgi:hypothetical protein
VQVGARVLIQRRAEESGGTAPAAAEDSDSDEEEEGEGAQGGADTQVHFYMRLWGKNLDASLQQLYR